MTKDLSRDVPGSIDLKAATRHLKGTPVLMLNKIVDQPFWVGINFLVLWTGHTSTVGDNRFSIRRDPDERYGHLFLKGKR